jgi:hypothetical protein
VPCSAGPRTALQRNRTRGVRRARSPHRPRTQACNEPAPAAQLGVPLSQIQVTGYLFHVPLAPSAYTLSDISPIAQDEWAMCSPMGFPHFCFQK